MVWWCKDCEGALDTCFRFPTPSPRPSPAAWGTVLAEADCMSLHEWWWWWTRLGGDWWHRARPSRCQHPDPREHCLCRCPAHHCPVCSTSCNDSYELMFILWVCLSIDLIPSDLHRGGQKCHLWGLPLTSGKPCVIATNSHFRINQHISNQKCNEDLNSAIHFTCTMWPWFLAASALVEC